MLFWKKRIYADAAAGTPPSKESRRELERLLNLYSNPSALHREALEAKYALEQARKTIADSIDAHADEIIFVGSGTEGNNLGIQGVLRPLLRTHGTLHAITSRIEHQSVLGPLRALKKEGLKLIELPVDTEGLVSPKALSQALTKKTVFVSIQLVNSEIGTIEPIKALVKEARRQGDALAAGLSKASPLVFHTDASQAPLWLPINVEKLGVDLLTLDGQKIEGPKGVGALYVRRGTPLEPIVRGGTQERGLRGGTENVPLIGAFAVALREAQEGVGERAEKISAVRNELLKEIERLIPKAQRNGPSLANRVANNINISIPGLDGETAVIALDSEGIAVSTRSACTTGKEEPSYVIQALGITKELAKGAIRITLLPDATHSDAHSIARALAKVAKRYRT